jgi:hypothetical protein
LATFNLARNRLFVLGVLKRFHGDRSRLQNDTIKAFAARLVKAKRTVAGTSYAISDDDLCMQLVIGLPKTIIWQTAKKFLLDKNVTFLEAVKYLRGIESMNDHGKKKQRIRT